MAQKNDSFIVYTEIREPLADLTDEQMGKLFRALLDYVADGKRPGFRGSMRMAFAFITQSVDRSLEKYQEISERRSAAGRAGGIASAEARKISKQNEANQANATFASNDEANEANQANASKSSKAKLPYPYPYPYPLPSPVPSTRARTREKENGGTVCEKCGKNLTEGVAAYSFNKFGRFICQKCQTETSKPPARAAGTEYKPDPAVVRKALAELEDEEAASEADWAAVFPSDKEKEE